jgi:MoxR-like ATPase
MAVKDGGHGAPGKIIAEVSRVVIGKDDIKQILLIGLLSQGHVLIEGLPGTAKTTIARTFAQAIGGTFKRVQGTPDMLPADILGFYFYRTDGTSTFMPGPIFANVLLADELNRTATRTQSALLEAMQEDQVTIEGVTRLLEQPFIVIASQIPHDGVGTSPLTEVQLDRFLFRVLSKLPGIEEEDAILKNIDAISGAKVSAVTSPAEIIRLQQEVKNVHVADNIRSYILDIVNRLRHHRDVQTGPSPRGSIALYTGARASAFIQGRDYVIPDDVKMLLIPALSHRLRISSEADIDNVTPESIIDEVVSEAAVPKEGIVSRNKLADIPKEKLL